MRAKVANAFVQADGLKISVAEFFESQKRCPHNGEGDIEAADGYATNTVASIAVETLADDQCGITVALGTVSTAVPAVLSDPVVNMAALPA